MSPNVHFSGLILKFRVTYNNSISFKLWHLRKIILLGKDHIVHAFFEEDVLEKLQ